MARGNDRSKQVLNDRQSPSRTSISQTLISAIRSSEGSKLPLLRNLYGLLVCLSNKSVLGSTSARFELCEFVMKSDDRENVGELLFKELECRFEKFFSALCELSVSSGKEHALLRFNVSACIDELAVLLRCCMVLLTLADLDVVLEKTQILLHALGNLVSFVHRVDKDKSFTIERRVSHEFSYSDAACTTSVSEDFVALLSIVEHSDPCSPFLRVLLEVFADELIVHRMLRDCFMRAATFSTSKSLFLCHFHNGGIRSVLEVISLHFILSLSEEKAFENFLTRLSCRDGSNPRVCEIGLTSSLSLLLNPLIVSAPKVLQGHLMLLVSQAISVALSGNVRPSIQVMGASCLTIFERSIVLYTGFISTFLVEGHPMGWKSSFLSPKQFDRSTEYSFECLIQEKTRAKVDDIVARFGLWNFQRHIVYDKTKCNLLVDSIVGIEESRVDKSCKNDILEILKIIVLGAFSDSDNNTMLYEKGETSLQDVSLLAAVLKLISGSMLAVIRCLRWNGEKFVCLEEALVCKEYNFIVQIIGCFQHFNVCLPNQKKLFDMMENDQIRHKTTKWMLLHISGFLSLSFASGFDFLVENCVSTLVALLNLYAFEEGNVVAMRSLLVPDSKSFLPQSILDKAGEALVDQRLCQKIASRIQKIRSVHLSSESLSCFSQPEDEIVETPYSASTLKCSRKSNGHLEEETEETFNGKVFLDCLLENSSNVPDYDDLASFIECKAGKDYSKWLKDKERHRRWRFKKMAVLRWKQRKETWKLVNANKSWPLYARNEET